MERTDVDSALGPAYGRNVRLEAHRITMRGEMPHRPGSGNPVLVSWHRDGDRITFGTDALGAPLTGGSHHSTIVCAKSG